MLTRAGRSLVGWRPVSLAAVVASAATCASMSPEHASCDASGKRSGAAGGAPAVGWLESVTFLDWMALMFMAHTFDDAMTSVWAWVCMAPASVWSARGIAAMLTMAASEPGLPVQPDEFDADPWVLNVLNGTLNLRTGDLREHRRADLITTIAPVAWDEKATCPKWESCLETWQPDPGGRAFLRRLVLALLLVFHHRSPGGLRLIGSFLELVDLHHFVASSYGALYDLDQSLQTDLDLFAQQILVDQDRPAGLQLDGGAHVADQLLRSFDDLHCAAAEHTPEPRGARLRREP